MVYRARPVTIASANGFGRLADGAVTGTPAEIALECMRQIGSLLLVKRGRRHDHASAAITALERLSVEEGLLHWMQRAVLGKPLNRGHDAAGGTERRHQAGMDRHAVEPHRTGTAIAGIAPLLDPEHAALAEKGPQTLAGLRLGGKELPVDGETHLAAGWARPAQWHIADIVHAPAPGAASSARICSVK
jgi:hypothetical protein